MNDGLFPGAGPFQALNIKVRRVIVSISDGAYNGFVELDPPVNVDRTIVIPMGNTTTNNSVPSAAVRFQLVSNNVLSAVRAESQSYVTAAAQIIEF